MIISRRFSVSRLLLIAGILLIASNLRAPMTSVAPLFGVIQEYFSLTASTAGLLTSLPLFVLAVMSPLCAGLAARFGLARMLFFAVCAISAGVVVRSAGSLPLLFAGTALIGVGIATGNVLLPALVKRDFPHHIPLLTSVYALMMGIVAALISASVVPLANVLSGGWLWALAISAIPAFLSVLIWLPQLRHNHSVSPVAAAPALKRPVWRYRLAWQITFFLACNSVVYYTMISWLPAMLHDAGFNAAFAGRLHGLMQLASALSGFLILAVLPRVKDQRALAALTTAVAMLGIVGLWLLPGWSLIWSFLFGFGNGATFILALSFFGLRTVHAGQAAALSGMAQCVAYLLASLAPWLMGKLHDVSGSWVEVFLACAVINAGIAVLGMFAGRTVQISDD